MAEWLLLLLLVPAIVVPVVLVIGFAGCSFRSGEAVERIYIDWADPKSVNLITLAWHTKYVAPSFVFDRTNLSNNTTFSFPAPDSPFDDSGQFPGDPGLEPATFYNYVLRGVLSDGSDGQTSDPLLTRTLAFETVFDETATFESPNGHDGTPWAGLTLVQRIEARALTPLSPADRTVGQVRITLRASNAEDASIDRIFVSQPDPTPGANLYDSDTDHMEVPLPTTPFVVGKGTSSPPLVVNYTGVHPAKSKGPMDPGTPLLIAVDFTASPPASTLSGIRFEDGQVPSSKGTGYWKSGAEAALTTRSSNYQPEMKIYLIEKIEIG